MNEDDKVYNISSHGKIHQVEKEDIEEVAKEMLVEATKAGKSTMTKFCLTIFACSVVKTAGRILIARNYAKKF